MASASSSDSPSEGSGDGRVVRFPSELGLAEGAEGDAVSDLPRLADGAQQRLELAARPWSGRLPISRPRPPEQQR